ncbi:hypothetical protein B0H14DRAFT_3123072 [Mycena olivaceomarginata]|nr:hypothetical protein B0H14DRAFT_3123072 [Mycena olivaceomarginata]
MTFQIGTRFAVNQRLCCIFSLFLTTTCPCHSSTLLRFSCDINADRNQLPLPLVYAHFQTKSTLNQPAKFRGAFRHRLLVAFLAPSLQHKHPRNISAWMEAVESGFTREGRLWPISPVGVAHTDVKPIGSLRAVRVVDLRYAAAAASSPAPALIVPGNFGPSHCPRPPRRDENTPHTRPRVQFPLPIYFAVPVAAVLRKNRPRAYETGGLGGAAGVHDPRAHGMRSGASGGDIGCTALQVAPAPHRSSPPPAAQLPHQSRAAVRTVAGGTAGSRARQPVRRRAGRRCGRRRAGRRDPWGRRRLQRRNEWGPDRSPPAPAAQLPHQSRAAVRAAEGRTAGRQDPRRERQDTGLERRGGAGRVLVWVVLGKRLGAGRAAPHLPANFIWKIFYYSFWQFIPKCRESDSIGNDCQDGWTGSFDANNEQQRY